DARAANLSAWNFDFGARATLNSQLQLGLVGQNLLNQEKGILPRRYVGAIEFSPMSTAALSAQIFKLDANTLGTGFTLPDPAHTLGWSVGGEYRFNPGICLRAGYLSNPSWLQRMA